MFGVMASALSILVTFPTFPAGTRDCLLTVTHIATSRTTYAIHVLQRKVKGLWGAKHIIVSFIAKQSCDVIPSTMSWSHAHWPNLLRSTFCWLRDMLMKALAKWIACCPYDCRQHVCIDWYHQAVNVMMWFVFVIQKWFGLVFSAVSSQCKRQILFLSDTKMFSH